MGVNEWKGETAVTAAATPADDILDKLDDDNDLDPPLTEAGRTAAARGEEVVLRADKSGVPDAAAAPLETSIP